MALPSNSGLGEGTSWISPSILSSCGRGMLFDPTGKKSLCIHEFSGMVWGQSTVRSKVRKLIKSIFGVLAFPPVKAQLQSLEP